MKINNTYNINSFNKSFAFKGTISSRAQYNIKSHVGLDLRSLYNKILDVTYCIKLDIIYTFDKVFMELTTTPVEDVNKNFVDSFIYKTTQREYFMKHDGYTDEEYSSYRDSALANLDEFAEKGNLSKDELRQQFIKEEEIYMCQKEKEEKERLRQQQKTKRKNSNL